MTTLTNQPREITVRTTGTPDITLAAELFAPLFLKIHERNQSKRPALRIIGGIECEKLTSQEKSLTASR